MNYRVGDRVRVIANNGPREADKFIGLESTIVECRRGLVLAGWCWRLDGVGNGWHFRSDELAPLTPPAEDAWASEQVRKVTRPVHVEPVAPKVTV